MNIIQINAACNHMANSVIRCLLIMSVIYYIIVKRQDLELGQCLGGDIEGRKGTIQTINNKFTNDNQEGKRFDYTVEDGRGCIENELQMAGKTLQILTWQ